MDLIRTQRYASPKKFSPESVASNAEQQRIRDERFIQEYQAVKQIEIDQEAAAISNLKEKNAAERQNLVTNNTREKQYQDQKDQLRLKQIEREQQLQRQVAGADSSDKNFNKILDTVTQLSKTAISAAVGIGKIQKEGAEAAGEAAANKFITEGGALAQQEDAALAQQTATLGAKAQETVYDRVGLEKESFAAQQEKMGNNTLAYVTRDMNQWERDSFTKTVAGHYGKTYAQDNLVFLQQQQIDNPDFEYTMASGEKKRIGEIDLGKAENLNELLSIRAPSYLKEKGLGGLSDLALSDFYANAAQSKSTVVGSVRSAQISEQKETRVDRAKQKFQMNPTPLGAKLLYQTADQTGSTPKQSREIMLKSWENLTNQQFTSMGDMPFGPNGKPFREQYPDEWRDAVAARNSAIEADRSAERFQIESANEEAILEFDKQMMVDLEDGSFDANPITLSEAAAAMEAKGLDKAAEHIRGRIPLTASKQYDKRFLESLDQDISSGILNYTPAQITGNPSLSSEAKRQALSKITEFEATSVPTDVKTADKGIVDAYIDKRAKVNTFTKGPADPSVKVMKDQAWSRYSQVYSEVYRKTGSVSEARAAAKADFISEFGEDETKGTYAVTSPLDNTGSGQYVNGKITGKAYSSGNYVNKAEETVHAKGAKRAFSEPDLYPQEKADLTEMLEGVKSGKITVPSTIYGIAKQSGGNMSVRQLVNMRLEANEMDPLPDDVGMLTEQVERSFDPRYNKFLNYQPSPRRTDIAAIGSGMDPIYEPTIPTPVKQDTAFQSSVTQTAQNLGISEADLYAVMSFETGGTFDPNIRNAAGSGATGLIQFMPNTARGLGTSTEALSRMSRPEQMRYVETYLRNAGVKPGMGLSDLYMAVLFPAAVGKSDDFVLFGNGAMKNYRGVAYDQNSGLDKNRDGSITKGEAAVKVLGHRNPWRQPRNVRPELVN